MFVRVKKVGPYQYLQIAENHREGKRVKQTIIATLGRLDKLAASGAIDQLLRSAARFPRSHPAYRSMPDADGVAVARGFEGPLRVRVESRRQRSPRLHDLPSLQKLASARFGWSASKTLEVAQELYDGAGKKILTYRGNVVEFHRDIAADKRHRKKGVRTFHQPAGASVRNHSVWWGVDGVRLVEARVVPAADLALGRLEPFDPASVAHYPVWKDPSRDFAPGRSLCKLGFPLHRIVPVYDEKANTFTLPDGSVLGDRVPPVPRRHLRPRPSGLSERRVQQGEVRRWPLGIAEIPDEIVKIPSLGVRPLKQGMQLAGEQ